MKRLVISIALSALVLFASASNWKASAASARCVAGCAHWCATKFAMKNATACNESCQAKHCH
jgi:hypothetical protein